MKEFDLVLVHELTHAMIFGLAKTGVPAWIHEGLASYFEPRDQVLAARRLKTIGAVPLSSLAGGFLQLLPIQAVAAYDESVLAADILMQRIGPRMGVFLQYLGSGQSVEQTLRVFGLDLQMLDAGIKNRLK